MYSREKQSAPQLEQLARECLKDSERWFGDTPASKSVAHYALAMAGEVGEFCNIVKKIDRHSLDATSAKVRMDLAMELTDVLVYVLTLSGMLNIDLTKSYTHVRALNEKRFMQEREERNNVSAAD